MYDTYVELLARPYYVFAIANTVSLYYLRSYSQCIFIYLNTTVPKYEDE